VQVTKHDELRRLIGSFETCLVAYSGGVDSVFLAHVTAQVLGDKALAVIADSPSLPRRELVEAKEIAEKFDFPLEIITTSEFENPDYATNPVNRCYFCKHELFTHLEHLAADRGFSVVAYGENASDIGDYRPGAKAASEFEVRSPLKEVGLTKSEIRKLSAELGLPTADKPAAPCLSSRIPYGQAVNTGKLALVEQAEAFLHDLGLREIRVRHHEPDSATEAKTARIELGETEAIAVDSKNLWGQIDKRLCEIGYTEVVRDKVGYRRGSLNPVPAPALS
jgi:pyridinium-3,5-biscarboxylic acid mononucleotide sulfurtransferase